MMITEYAEGIWKVVGTQTGPTVCVLGGTHGNELTGIEVVKQMLDEVRQDRLILTYGTLYLILANPRAIERNTRGSADHLDLNRRFTLDVLERPLDGTYEDARAKQLAPILRSSNICMDIHATNKPSVPMIAGAQTPEHLALYKWFSCDKILTDPNYILGGLPCTTDEYVDQNGGLGVCYESGQTNDLSRIEETKITVTNILRAQKMIEGEFPVVPDEIQKKIYRLETAVRLTEKGFRFADGKGTSSFESFIEGEILGYTGEEPFFAPYDGVIVFPKIAEHWKVGEPVCYLARGL